MPFKKPFTDDGTGATYPDAFWYPGAFNLSVTDKVLVLKYVAVVNQASVMVKSPLDRSERLYTFTGAAFASLLQQIAAMPPSTDTVAVQLSSLMDSLALAYPDVQNENGTFSSFFADAEHVPADLSTLG